MSTVQPEKMRTKNERKKKKEKQNQQNIVSSQQMFMKTRTDVYCPCIQNIREYSQVTNQYN